MSLLTKILAMLTLALWGLATIHCQLEGVPGFAFLQSCCFTDSGTSAPHDCESDGCCTVEYGKYRFEAQTVSAPQPLVILAPPASAIERPLSELRPPPFAATEFPPELPRLWQFTQRTALPPRAPSVAS